MDRMLPTTRTTPTKTDFARALLHEWPGATKEGAGVLWAHFAGETGDGIYCWNWNLGNVKHTKGDGYDYVSLKGVWEGFTLKDEDADGDIDADDRTILVTRLLRSGMWVEDTSPDHAVAVGKTKISMLATPLNQTTWFRAYPSLEVGMHQFVDMKRRVGGRYSGAWSFVEAGDPEGYGRELGKLGYYTASQDAYARSMRSKFNAWMNTTAWEEVMGEDITEPSDTPVPSIAVLSSPDHILEYTMGSLVSVEHEGEEWLVSPIYIAPIGIGQAMTLASTLGFKLPTPALVDSIWRASDLKVPPHLMIRQHDGVHMDTDALHAAESQALTNFVGDRALGKDFYLVGGAFKDVVMIDGKPGLYGWHADEMSAAKLGGMGVPVHPPITPGPGLVVQPPFTGHALGWRDYSQALRLVRRKQPTT